MVLKKKARICHTKSQPLSHEEARSANEFDSAGRVAFVNALYHYEIKIYRLLALK